MFTENRNAFRRLTFRGFAAPLMHAFRALLYLVVYRVALPNLKLAAIRSPILAVTNIRYFLLILPSYCMQCSYSNLNKISL